MTLLTGNYALRSGVITPFLPDEGWAINNIVSAPSATTTTSPTPSTQPGTGFGTASPGAAKLAAQLNKAAPVLAIIGGINSAIGAFYQVKAAQAQLKAQSENLRFQGDMARINAQAAEYQAQQVMLAGERQIGQYTLRAGQARASAETAIASRGIQAGVGSAKEAIASMDLIKEMDVLAINANTVRAAEATRMQKQNYLTQAAISDVSAANALASAGSMSAGIAATSSLLGSATSYASNWASNRRLEQMLGSRGF